MAADQRRVIAPGGTIGILGGGQLGRMMSMAAARLGYRCHIFTPENDSPAAQVSAAATVADYTNRNALGHFAAAVDVVTLEFENIPAPSLEMLADLVPVRPGPKVLATSQDRILEKTFFGSIGIATPPWRPVENFAALQKAVKELGTPCVLKTARFGYDGKGQAKIEADTNLEAAWESVGKQICVLESYVDFEREVSSIAARGLDGSLACFDTVENRHKNHILDVTIAPAPISLALAAAAKGIAEAAASALDVIGLLTVELFVTRDGHLLANEMAPRPHNSGHWTIDACTSSQFEQSIRAACGLPLGSPERHSDAVMTNLIGDDVLAWPQLVAEPGAILHLYGKTEARAGRKMGHVTRLKARSK